MASWVPELPAAVPRVLAFEGCSGSVLSGAPSGCRGPGGHSGLGETRLAAEGQGSNLPRSVLSERERRLVHPDVATRGGPQRRALCPEWELTVLCPGSRKRIAVSCEHLRALLPQFDGRREDMASVLEMAVQFLRLAHALGPREHQVVLVPSRGVRQPWQQDVLRLDLLGQVPDSETGAPSTAPLVVPPFACALLRHQGPPSCAALGVDENKGPPGTSGTLGRLPALSGLGPCPHPPTALGFIVAIFLLVNMSCSLPGSLDGRGGTPGWAAARSSLLCSTEPAFLGDPEPSPQEFQDSSLEPWDSALGCPGPAPRDEAESIFPDFLAC
ncbi:Spermatogenesis- and oogenesis-specific basic helix-loop-helix-containing protein 1 [Tupaia chinensis]|uniref:Spermatogenesis-and oogenesis-specific basic helix-loop-helix-containing protein 1 n=1 Tax=Tupaia chinensis TaxID=246437 RepID=L8YFF8_TUPCH|nr:Spermatogenesis- and oogenesis-specific basic helix-loop-helix-containing protein 1 [Tupaia chinensis]